MALKRNNPAARLHFLLNFIHGASPNAVMIDMWSAILRASPNDRLGFFRRYGRVMALPARVRDTLLTIPDLDKAPFCRWIPKLEHAFTTQSLNLSVVHFTGVFDKMALENLEICAVLLSRERPEKEIDAAALAKLAQEAEQLRRDTIAAKIDQRLKIYILDGLADITSAIEDYDLEGIDSLERSVERAFGSVLLKNDQTGRLKETSVGKRFAQFLYGLYVAVNAANGAFQLTHNMQQLLLPETQVVHQEIAPTGQNPNGNAQQHEMPPDTTSKNV